MMDGANYKELENRGASWILYQHKIISSRLYNQPTRYHCQSTCASQLLVDNHSINYDINQFHELILRSSDNSRLTLPYVRNALNTILNGNYYRVVYPVDYAREFFHQRIEHGKAWMVSVRESVTMEHGHTLLVCGLTRNRSIKVFDPWGKGPQSGMGTLGILAQDIFFNIWENSRYGAIFSDH